MFERLVQHVDRRALSDVRSIAGRHFGSSTVDEAPGVSRDGRSYDYTLVRYCFERSLTDAVVVSRREERIAAEHRAEGAQGTLVGFREWRFSFSPGGELALVSRRIGSGGTVECAEWVDDAISWFQRFRAASLCRTIVGLHRAEDNAVDPLRGLSLPARHLR